VNKRFRLPLLLACGALLAALASRNGDLAWLALPFMAYLFAGLVLSPSPRQVRLRAERAVKMTEGEGVTEIGVSVSVTNEGRKTVCLRIEDPVPPGSALSEGETSLLVSLRPGGAAKLGYSFESARGSFAWRTLRVTAEDPLGLTESAISVAAPASVVIRPRYRRYRPLAFRPWKAVSSPGPIPIRLGGSGTDFWGVREYRSGDPLKSLDWRLTARHPRQFFTREYVQEKNAEVELILDGRPETELKEGEASLFEIEVRTVSSLASMFLRQGHQVGLHVFGRPSASIQPNYGKTQLYRILNCLARIDTDADDVGQSFIELPPGRFSGRTFMLVVSPFLPDDLSFYQRLRALGYQALLVAPDTLHFSRPSDPADRATRLARRAYRLERRVALDRVEGMAIPVIDWKTDKPLQPLLRNAFRRPLNEIERVR
jgi:uncharacterized protein (DUF58 family)